MAVFVVEVEVEVGVIKSLTQLTDMQLFKRRRAEQLSAVKAFKNNPYQKQVAIVSMVAKKLFGVIENSRVMLEASDYIPGISRFPENENLRDSLSNILENTALFGEIILRYPDVTLKIFQENDEFSNLYKWAVTFMGLNQNLLDSSTLTLVHLVSQELNYTERDPNYSNPYKKIIHSQKPPIQMPQPKKKKPKLLKKGPRLTPHIEL